MSSKDLGAAVCRNPRLLSMSVPKNLAVKLQWLKDLAIPAHKLGALICSYPLLVSFSLGKLQASRNLLVEGLAVPEESVGTVMLKCPQLFGLTTTTLTAKAAYLCEALRLSKPQLADLIGPSLYIHLVTYSRALIYIYIYIYSSVPACADVQLGLEPGTEASILETRVALLSTRAL